MVQDSIEAILRQKLGLDANSVGSRLIARAIEQRQNACNIHDRTAYLKLITSSPQELNQLIEAVVVPETWFFRDKGSFEVLRNHVKETAPKQLRVLSLPCSTGEEPYSIAIALLEAGLTPTQFRVDAVDISQHALTKAKQAVYSNQSFRGGTSPNLDRYFQQVDNRYEVQPAVRESVNFIRGNVLEPHFLIGKQYQVVFCRNLLIYLDESARRRTIDVLDRALIPQGLLFLGAVETPQIVDRAYTRINHPAAFAFEKQPSQSSKTIEQKQTVKKSNSKPHSPKLIDKKPNPLVTPQQNDRVNFSSLSTPLETAKQLADRGELSLAAELCESHIRTYPVQAPAYLLLGEIYQALNQPRSAEQAFQKAIYLNPNIYDALIHLSLLKAQQGNQAESNRLKKRAQRLINLEFQ